MTQTREWLNFIHETQGAELVLAEVRDANATVGYFTGMTTSRLGVRILGSPLPGWSTSFHGFNLVDGVSRADALDALIVFAFRELGVHHIEFRDRHLTAADVRDPKCHIEQFETWEVDISRDEDAIFAGFTSACRRAIRKSEKVGLTVEEATPEGFAEEYYAQLVEVFAKQGAIPTYGVDRVQSLIRHLYPTGRLLLLRARDPEGAAIATGLYPAHGTTMFFWGGASWRSGQQHRPNEAIFWHALRHWKARGVTVFDLGGGGEYKRKYGGENVFIPHVVRSRNALLWQAREWMRKRNDPDNPGGRFAVGDRTPGATPDDDAP